MARLSNFAFITNVPGTKAEQAALFDLLTQALDGLAGPWNVGVCRGTAVSWIILSILRGDGFECSLFLDEPVKQTALYVREQVVEGLRLQEMESSPSRSAALRKNGP